MLTSIAKKCDNKGRTSPVGITAMNAIYVCAYVVLFRKVSPNRALGLLDTLVVSRLLHASIARMSSGRWPCCQR
jgi:hypothetical protein